ncbi:MAG: PQQ-binding-like beta-propeller repeat protein [Bacteroidales bacterium]
MVFKSILILLAMFVFHEARGQIVPPTLEPDLTDFKEVPEIKWTFETNSPVFSSPVTDGDLVFFGGCDSVFHAVGLSSGKEKWRFHTRGEIRSTALVTGNRVFFNGGDGSFYMLDKNNGTLLWKYSTEREKRYDFADYFNSSPVLYDGVLYFGSGDNNLYAINPENGRLIWSFRTGNIVHSTPAVSNGKIFFGSFDGFVYALDLKTGGLVWKFKTVGHRYFPAGEVQGSPAVFKNLVFIGARDYNVYALDQEKGYCHWNKAFKAGWGLNNNIHDSVLYTGSADERVLIASDPATGNEFWNKKMEFLVFGNNAYSEKNLYIGTTNGKLHAISMKTGEKQWSFETDSYKRNKSKYFKPDDSYRDDIYSIIKSNIQFLEVECELGGVFSTPLLVKDFLIFTSTNGTVYCLGK